MSTLATSYTFTIEDLTRPSIQSILWIAPRQCRIQFTEPMGAGSGPGGTLFLEHISGLLEIGADNIIQLAGTTPLSTWVGYTLQLTGSTHPTNNYPRVIAAVDTTLRTITLDAGPLGNLAPDDGVDKDATGNIVRTRTLRLTISPYTFSADLADEGVDSDPESEERIQCAYLPLQLSSALPLTEELPADGSVVPEEYVVLTFHDDVSIDRIYSVEVDPTLTDAVGNVIDGTSLQYTTPRFGIPTNRINMWDFFPEKIRGEDLANSGELRKMAVVLQDMQNLYSYRVDQLAHIPDAATCPEHLLDFLLHKLGNPFTFNVDTEQRKRRLASSLKSFYRKLGTKTGIETMLDFFLGGTFDVKPFLNAGTWFVGSSLLGVDTILGTGNAYYRNCYQVVSYRALTDAERTAVIEIATWADPVNMHLIAVVEPGQGATQQVFWILGSGIVGQTTMLNA